MSEIYSVRVAMTVKEYAFVDVEADDLQDAIGKVDSSLRYDDTTEYETDALEEYGLSSSDFDFDSRTYSVDFNQERYNR